MAETPIEELLSQRTDLSPFIVHLTRASHGHSAKYNLKRILKRRKLEARSAFGQALGHDLSKAARASQKCVSFSETPIEHIKCMIGEIPKRKISLSPYGLAFTKMVARKRGANPVWYLDITHGSNRDWLTKPVEKLVAAATKKGNFEDSPIAKLCPFIEQMGSGTRADGYKYQKEFWWEREWRHQGDFGFLWEEIAFGLAPEESIDEFERLMEKEKLKTAKRIRFFDPRWSLNRIISHLCRCKGPFTPFDREEDEEDLL